MTKGLPSCPACGAPVPRDASTCPACKAALPPQVKTEGEGTQELQALMAKATGSESRTSRSAKGKKSPGLSPRVQERFQRLVVWQEGAKRLGVEIPLLPGWAKEAAAEDQNEERWEEVLRGVERVAHVDITKALETWHHETAARLTRLEAYDIPSPNEKKNLLEVGRATRAGDLDRALELYQKVDRVVTLKERALDQARDDVESLGVLIADMRTMGLPLPADDPNIMGRLEADLRKGKVGETRAQVAELKEKAHASLIGALPPIVNAAAEKAAVDKAEGKDVSADVGLLARSARALRKGQPEEALRGVVKLRSQKLLDPFARAQDEATGTKS